MPIIKKREIEMLAQMNGEEIERFLKRLPAEKERLEGLFDYLEMKLEDQPCDHTARFAMQYMMQKGMNFPQVSGWLSQNGGSCDCKILEEIATEWWKVFDGADIEFQGESATE